MAQQIEYQVRWYAEVWQCFNMNGAGEPWRVYVSRDLPWLLRLLAESHSPAFRYGVTILPR